MNVENRTIFEIGLIFLLMIGCGADDIETMPAAFLDVSCVDGNVEISFSSPPREVRVEYIEHAFSASGDFSATGVKLPAPSAVKGNTVMTQCAPSVSQNYVYFISVSWLHGDTVWVCPCKQR